MTNYSKAAELDTKNPDIYNNIGVIYKELRQYDRAIEEFLRAIYLNPTYAKPYNNIGVVYYAKKDFPGAIRNYQKAISIDPKNLEALNNLAVAFKRIDQLEKSKSILNQALKINLAHAGTHYNLAVLYEKEGNLKSEPFPKRDMMKFLFTSGRNGIRSDLELKRNGKKGTSCYSTLLCQKKFSRPKPEN